MLADGVLKRIDQSVAVLFSSSSSQVEVQSMVEVMCRFEVTSI